MLVTLHVWRTIGMLESQRELYLRNRIATLAVRVESLPAEQGDEAQSWLDVLYDEEPSLLEARVISNPGEDATAADILAGRRLFRMDSTEAHGESVLRAWFPVHRDGQLRVMRMDFSASAADFLNAYAAQSILLVSFIAAALIALSLYAFRLAGRTALLERRHAEMKHLARLGEMSAVLAHEIRNPLGSIKGFGQLLAEKAQGQEQTFAAEIVEQSTRLERLVNDLLLYGRVPDPRIQAIRWNDLADRLQRAWSAEEPPQTVTLAIDRTGVEFHSDPALLEQALKNLIRNAQEALEQHVSTGEFHGSIIVSMERTRTGSAIRVTDNGPGLSDEARRRLFEPFFTTKPFGTGLGLSITRKLVAALGGELRLDAESGRGLCATIRLPNVSQG